MPVQPAIKMWSRQNSNADTTDNFRKLKVGFTEAYQVLHDANSTDLDIYSAQGLPYVGQRYSGTDFVLAKRGAIQRVGPIFSIVTINYEGEVAPVTGGGGGGGSSSNSPSSSPINNTPLVDWSNVISSEEIDVDRNGLPLTNVISDPVKGLKKLIVDQVVTIQRNFLDWNTYLQSRYMDATNSDEFLGWPPGTGKVMDLTANNVIGQTNGYWKATLKVQFRIPYRTTPERAWWLRYLNEGYYEYFEEVQGPPNQDGVYPPNKIRIVDEHKKPITKPAMLDQFGKKLTDINAAVWIERQIYDSLPLNSLGFI
jgi:hypothetical protein